MRKSSLKFKRMDCSACNAFNITTKGGVNVFWATSTAFQKGGLIRHRTILWLHVWNAAVQKHLLKCLLQSTSTFWLEQFSITYELFFNGCSLFAQEKWWSDAQPYRSVLPQCLWQASWIECKDIDSLFRVPQSCACRFAFCVMRHKKIRCRKVTWFLCTRTGSLKLSPPSNPFGPTSRLFSRPAKPSSNVDWKKVYKIKFYSVHTGSRSWPHRLLM